MRRSINTPTCHPDRPHRAKDMCSSCYSTYLSQQWRKNHPGYESARKKKSGYKQPPRTSEQKFHRRFKRHNITVEQYNALLAQQKGRCATCKNLVEFLHIDHDHSCCPGEDSCGKCIRGLLCGNCNTAIGFAHDNKEVLLSMAKYVSGQRM